MLVLNTYAFVETDGQIHHVKQSFNLEHDIFPFLVEEIVIIFNHFHDFLNPNYAFDVYHKKIGVITLLMLRFLLPFLEHQINMNSKIIFSVFLSLLLNSAERNSSSVVVKDLHHGAKNERGYALRAAPLPFSKHARRRSVSVIDLQGQQPSTIEFRRPRRTSRSASPANSFRYILPFNSQREQKRRNRESVPITKSPMYNENYF